MATKVTLIDISSGFKGTDIQTNFTSIEDEFDKVVYRDGTSPNQMTSDLDLNSNRIVNLPAPTSSTEPLRKDDQFTSTEAQSFATDAETAKDAAETALSNFQSQYVGPSASDPSVDGNGDALTEGDLYFDTTNDVLKAYDGSSWVVSANQFFPNVDANVTATEDDLNKTSHFTNVNGEVTATDEELNILDGVTATTAELNNADESATAGGGFMKGPTTSSAPGLAFDTWRTPNANRSTLVTITVTASTDGTDDASVLADVDESGGTVRDYIMGVSYAPSGLGASESVTDSLTFLVPPGASYQIRNDVDPNTFNNIQDHREFTL